MLTKGAARLGWPGSGPACAAGAGAAGRRSVFVGRSFPLAAAFSSGTSSGDSSGDSNGQSDNSWGEEEQQQGAGTDEGGSSEPRSSSPAQRAAAAGGAAGTAAEGAAAVGAAAGDGGAGSLWQLCSTLRFRKHSAQVHTPPAMLAAWFPGAALPLEISLQLVVDGNPWGPRFPSSINTSHKINRGFGAFEELDGCRVVRLRLVAAGPTPALDLLLSSLEEGEEGAEGGAAEAASAGRRGFRIGRPLEAADLEEGVWPVCHIFSLHYSRMRILNIPRTGFPTLWPGAAPPPAVRVQFVLDGAPQGGPLEARFMQPRSPLSRDFFLFAAAVERLPLPVGAVVLRYRRAGAADLLEVHARSGDGATADPARKRRRVAEQQQQQQPAGAGTVLPSQTPATAAQPVPLALAPQAASVQLPAAAGAQLPPAVVPAADGAAAAATAAALRALQLAAAAPTAADAPGAAAALEEAVFTAYGEVERAAQALGLPLAAVDAACDGVAAATEQAPSARRFLRMEYPRLVRAAAAGEEGLVRAWMQRAARAVPVAAVEAAAVEAAP